MCVNDSRAVSPVASSALTRGRSSCASGCVLEDEQPMLTQPLELCPHRTLAGLLKLLSSVLSAEYAACVPVKQTRAE